MDYTKEFKERDELLDQLAERGLEVPDRHAALQFLTRVGYFRSGAYRYVLRDLLPPERIDPRLREFRSDQYIAGASFGLVVQLEAFDSKLARVCLEGLLDFEVRVRAAIAHTLAARDVSAHTRIDCLDERMCSRPAREGTKFEAWMETCDAAIKAAAEDEDFIAHHLLKYPDQPVPIWAVTEALSFGKLPFLFELMKTEDAREVARAFGFEHPRRFGAVLWMMADLRNTCAHGSRLFNRAFKRPLSLKSHETKGDMLDHVVVDNFTTSPKPRQRLYIYAAVLAFMLRTHVAGTNWHMSFKTQAKKLDINLRAPDGTVVVSREGNMGFPVGWEGMTLWSNSQ
ncbi:Abi family protein [Microbacterium sp. dk485]|uniref:Abi family protein n=1 Tax=Microbacterium TaxID=33882 RepID=UPI001074909B|nr:MULTISPECIES: Abi family protein [Microbacterium]TFV84611.1 Abi family protein [Microbacterium sp. dk485]TXK14607.1 Abi family protein [Microbacterium wangchenii]